MLIFLIYVLLFVLIPYKLKFAKYIRLIITIIIIKYSKFII